MPEEQDSLDALALEELQALLNTPGELKIITNEPRTDLKRGLDTRSASAYVCHDVVALDGPNDQGRYVAHSAEGDWTMGYPAALLSRLQQWRDN